MHHAMLKMQTVSQISGNRQDVSPKSVCARRSSVPSYGSGALHSFPAYTTRAARKSLVFVPRKFQQSDQFVNLGFLEAPQCLDCLFLHWTVEFSHQIEPRFGNVAKDLSSIAGRTLTAYEFLGFQAVQQPSYTRCVFDHPLRDF